MILQMTPYYIHYTVDDLTFKHMKFVSMSLILTLLTSSFKRNFIKRNLTLDDAKLIHFYNSIRIYLGSCWTSILTDVFGFWRLQLMFAAALGLLYIIQTKIYMEIKM